MAEKFNGLQIFMAAEFVGDPLPRLFAIVEIQHGGNGVDTQPVDMVLVRPIQSVCDQKVGYLMLAIVKYFSSPVRMLSLAGIGIFIGGSSVEIGQTVSVSRKMGRNPVQYEMCIRDRC